MYRTEPPLTTPVRMSQTNYSTTWSAISSPVGVAPTPEYLCQTGHIISPAPLLQLADLSQGVRLTSTTTSPGKSVQLVKMKAACKQAHQSQKPPQRKKSDRIMKRKGVIQKKKKEGGLKVKIHFPSVSKGIKEMSGASKDSASATDVSSSETVTSGTLQHRLFKVPLLWTLVPLPWILPKTHLAIPAVCLEALLVPCLHPGMTKTILPGK